MFFYTCETDPCGRNDPNSSDDDDGGARAYGRGSASARRRAPTARPAPTTDTAVPAAAAAAAVRGGRRTPLPRRFGRHAKVGQLDGAAAVDEHVGALEVAVHDALVMHAPQGMAVMPRIKECARHWEGCIKCARCWEGVRLTTLRCRYAIPEATPSATASAKPGGVPPRARSAVWTSPPPQYSRMMQCVGLMQCAGAGAA